MYSTQTRGYRQPAATRRTASKPRPYSGEQLKFVRDLADQHQTGTAPADQQEAGLLGDLATLLGNSDGEYNPETDTFVSMQAARLLIDYLKAQPYKPGREPIQMETGVYRRGGILFLVKWNGSRTRTYAMEILDGNRTAYRKDIRDLMPDEKVPADEEGRVLSKLSFGR